uniref:Uncharacterized protein n=1 Tax=Avena sativa TaxID=4498 RepID=A0ACD5VZP0_AVESA
MDHLLPAAVFNNVPHLLDNPDHIQPLLNRAYADLDRNNALAFDATVRLREALRVEAELLDRLDLPAPTEEDWDKYDEIIDVIEELVATGVLILKRYLLLFKVIGVLLLVRARSRAHLLPLVLLAAVSAAVVVDVTTGGRVVPGLRSFVRFFLLMLDFLFAFDRPRRGW